jgi:hypothetical protein
MKDAGGRKAAGIFLTQIIVRLKPAQQEKDGGCP